MIKRILVPTAGPKPAKDKAEYIVYLASKLNVEVLDVIHILDLGEYDEGREALDIFVEVGKRFGIKVNTYIKEGNVVPTIVEFIEDLKPDIVVMGASEGRVVADWIVTQVMEHTQVPIIVIPYGVSFKGMFSTI